MNDLDPNPQKVGIRKDVGVNRENKMWHIFLFVCVCVHICIYIHIYIHTYIVIYINIHRHTYIYMHIYKYIYDGLSKCLFLVWLINRNSLRAASCLVFKTMTCENRLKPCILMHFIFHV